MEVKNFHASQCYPEDDDDTLCDEQQVIHTVITAVEVTNIEAEDVKTCCSNIELVEKYETNPRFETDDQTGTMSEKIEQFGNFKFAMYPA